MEPCPNCGASFATPFCHACGQKRVKPGIRPGEVLGDFVGGLFNADAPLLRTLREFLLRPGSVTRDYLAGKRRSYTPPVRFFLFGIAFYFLMRWLLDWDPVESMTEMSTGHAPVESSMTRVNSWMSRNVNLLLPLWVVMLASFDAGFFPRAGLRWVERVVHFLFGIGEYLVLATLMIPLIKLWPVLHLVNYVIIFGVLIWSVVHLHGGGAWTGVRAVVMVPLSFVFYVLTATVLVAWSFGIPLAELFQRPGG